MEISVLGYLKLKKVVSSNLTSHIYNNYFQTCPTISYLVLFYVSISSFPSFRPSLFGYILLFLLLQQFFEDGARIEAAFRKHIHRADPKQKQDSYEVIVCHANVIRYFVCR